MSFSAFLDEGQRGAQYPVGAGLHSPRSPLPCMVLTTESGIWDPYTSVPQAGDTTWPQAILSMAAGLHGPTHHTV